MVEWASGHPGSYHYLVVLKATDEDKMSTHSEAMLNEYLASAPAAAVEQSPAYRKMHYGWTATSRAGGDEARLRNFEARGLTRVEADAPGFVARPEAFACANYGSVKGSWEKGDCEQVRVRVRVRVRARARARAWARARRLSG
jgi:hypothetical protein